MAKNQKKLNFTEKKKRFLWKKIKINSLKPETLETSHILVKNKERFWFIKQLDKAQQKKKNLKS